MNVTFNISTYRDIIHRPFPILKASGPEIFIRLITTWVLCTARRTATGITPFAELPERAAVFYLTVWLWHLRQKSKVRYFFVQPWYSQKRSRASPMHCVACGVIVGLKE